MLSAKQRQGFADDGFVVVEGFKDSAEIAPLRRRAGEIVDQFDADKHRTIFTTSKQLDHVDDYFLGSATRVRCFFEREAFDVTGDLRVEKSLAINKIGHAMHDLDPVFSAFSHGPKLARLADDLGLVNPRIWQSMYIFKQPRIGDAVNWHQDASFFYTDPITVTTFWFALEDATINNGCLRALPGGHRGPLRERFCVDRAASPAKADLVGIDFTPWPAVEDATAIEVPAGSVVCFHGKLPHFSEANRSSYSRHAYTLHVTCATSQYDAQNWIQRPKSFPVRGFE